MANTRRDQEYLGIDTNVLVAYLDHEHPQHDKVRKLSTRKIALNPTIIHEAYHTLVFKMKWDQEEASQVLKEVATDESTLFVNQSLKSAIAGLELAVEYPLGGRDALIIANFIVGGIRDLRTFDGSLLEIREIKYGKRRISIRPP